MIAVNARPDLSHVCIWVGKYSDSYMVIRVGCRLKVGIMTKFPQTCSFVGLTIVILHMTELGNCFANLVILIARARWVYGSPAPADSTGCRRDHRQRFQSRLPRQFYIHCQAASDDKNNARPYWFFSGRP